MDAQQMIQELVEATGECWHKTEYTGNGEWHCSTCESDANVENWCNPSPTDICTLFGYVYKLGYSFDLDGYGDSHNAALQSPDEKHMPTYHGSGKTPAEALLNALHKSLENKNEDM